MDRDRINENLNKNDQIFVYTISLFSCRDASCRLVYDIHWLEDNCTEIINSWLLVWLASIAIGLDQLSLCYSSL